MSGWAQAEDRGTEPLLGHLGVSGLCLWAVPVPVPVPAFPEGQPCSCTCPPHPWEHSGNWAHPGMGQSGASQDPVDVP